MADYVELDRRFRDATHGVDSETTALLSYAASWNQVEAGLPWAEVLSHRFVVVLGEPGSGKTAEFKAQARLHDPSGKPRFFVGLDDLIQGSLGSALGPEQANRLQRWLTGSRCRASVAARHARTQKTTGLDSSFAGQTS